jgi:hypothetical protein
MFPTRSPRLRFACWGRWPTWHRLRPAASSRKIRRCCVALFPKVCTTASARLGCDLYFVSHLPTKADALRDSTIFRVIVGSIGDLESRDWSLDWWNSPGKTGRAEGLSILKPRDMGGDNIVARYCGVYPDKALECFVKETQQVVMSWCRGCSLFAVVTIAWIAIIFDWKLSLFWRKRTEGRTDSLQVHRQSSPRLSHASTDFTLSQPPSRRPAWCASTIHGGRGVGRPVEVHTYAHRSRT